MINYVVLPTEKEGEVLIEKCGHAVKFTVANVNEHMKQLERIKKELTAQMDLENSKMVNFKGFNPVIETLTPEQVFAVSLYHSAYEIHTKCVGKLKEVEDQLSEYTLEIAEIEKQTGIKF